jgi:hypothetical protein
MKITQKKMRTVYPTPLPREPKTSLSSVYAYGDASGTELSAAGIGSGYVTAPHKAAHPTCLLIGTVKLKSI